ncbi:MAG TPA: STAS domain-containing protein [Burkholderiales bacterium]
MVSRDGDIFRVSGPVTLENVTAVVQEGRDAFAGSDVVVDLSGLANVDSTAISMMLEWMRDAARGGRRMRYANLPENLRTLAKVYGVLEVLPLAG